MILFLDFDGVVHPFCAHEAGVPEFAYLPRIEAVLAEFAETGVVVCSDWRYVEPWEKILSFFSAGFRSRVLGATPALPNPHYRGGFRYSEALAYLERNRLDPERWVALDDIASNWPLGDPRVIVCDDGFGDREEALLRAALR